MICSKGLANRSSLLNGADGTGPYKLAKVSPGDHVHVRSCARATRGAPTAPRASGMPAKVVLKVDHERDDGREPAPHRRAEHRHCQRPRPRAAREGQALQEGRRSPGLARSSSTRTTGIPTANAAVRKGLVQALQLGQVGKVFTSGRGVPDEAADPADVHAVLRELGQGQRADAQLAAARTGAVGSSQPEAPLPDRRRTRLRRRDGARPAAALVPQAPTATLDGMTTPTLQRHAVRQRRLGRRARAARRQRARRSSSRSSRARRRRTAATTSPASTTPTYTSQVASATEDDRRRRAADTGSRARRRSSSTPTSPRRCRAPRRPTARA